MMLHTSVASTNESFSQWSTHGTALHLIIPADEQEILDQISGWKVPVVEDTSNIRASQHLAPQTSHYSALAKPCSIVVGKSTPKKAEESVQKSGGSTSKSLHKTVPPIITVDKKSHNRRYSLGDAKIFINNVLGMTKLKRSRSWPELYADSKDSSSPESSNISSRVDQSIANENNRLKMLSSANPVGDQALLSFSTNLEDIRKLSSNVIDKPKKGLSPKMKHQPASNDKDVQKSPYKSPQKYFNSTTKKPKVNVKKRILSPIKDVEENETSNILDNVDVDQPSKKQKMATSIKSSKHNDTGNKVTKRKDKSGSIKDKGTFVTLRNKHTTRSSNREIADAIKVQSSNTADQASFRNDLKHVSDNEDEIQSNVNESVESLSKEPFSPLKHSTPMIFDIPHNSGQQKNGEIVSNVILTQKQTSQGMQDAVQNIANESPSNTKCIYSQPEIFKDPDDTPNSSQSIIPNSNSEHLNSNLGVNSSMAFLHRDGIDVPYSQIPPEIMLSQAQSKFTSSDIPPEMVLSNISWGNSSLQIQPEIIPSQIPPKIVVSRLPPDTGSSQIQSEIVSGLIPHKKNNTQIPSPNMPRISPQGLAANSAFGTNVIPSPLKNMPNLFASEYNDQVKDLEPHKQHSTPVEENSLSMKMSQDLFPNHAEDLMNITSSGSIPCGQRQRSFSYMSSQPSSQDSVSEKIVSATPTDLQVGSAQRSHSFIPSPRCLPETGKIHTNMNDTYTILHGNSVPKLACPEIISNSNAQQISNAELSAKVLAARKKLVFQEKEKRTLINEPQVPTKNVSSKRKRKLSKDPKSYSRKKAKFISVIFTGNDVKSILDNMQEIY